MMLSLLVIVLVSSTVDSVSVSRDDFHNKLTSHYRRHNHKPHSQTVPWEYFMLVQEWPQSQCEYLMATHRHKCAYPKVATSWTMHGLWPSTDHGHRQPFYCTKSKFNFNKIKDIEKELLQYWPNLYVGASESSLWKHEYEKHGTCAASVDGFQDEHAYFSKTIELRERYDMQKALTKAGIEPSKDTTYEASAVQSALNEAYGVKTCPGCAYQEDIGQVLSQIYICLDKSLKPIDCKKECEKPCNSDEPIRYHPAQNTDIIQF